MLRRLLERLRRRADRRASRGSAEVSGLSPREARNRKALDDLVEMLAAFEAFRPNAYLCPAGVWTFGYGSTYRPDGSRVQPDDNIREPAARKLLTKTAMAAFDHALVLTNGYEPTAGCLSAVASLIYNVGPGAVGKSRFLAAWKRGDMEQAHFEFVDFNKVDGVPVDGLTRRREAEWKVLTGEEWKNVRF